MLMIDKLVYLETTSSSSIIFCLLFFCVQDKEYIQKGKETMEITWELMGLNDGWKSEKVKVCCKNLRNAVKKKTVELFFL